MSDSAEALEEAMAVAREHIAHARLQGLNPYDVIKPLCASLPERWELAQIIVALAHMQGKVLDLKYAKHLTQRDYALAWRQENKLVEVPRA